MRFRPLVQIAIIALSLIIIGCGRPKPTPTVAPPTKKEKPLAGKAQLKGGRIHLSDPKGNRTWEAEAATIEGDFASGSGTLRQVKCNIVENGKPTISARADTASYLPKQKTVLLQGRVKATWPARAAQMQADKVLWALEKKHIDATGNVILERAGERLEGNSLRTDLGLKEIDIQ